MSLWRFCVGLILVLLVALPAALPLLDLLHQPAAWSAWTEAGRLLSLSRNTLALAGGTILLALPAGTLLAVLLQRTDLPGRGCLRLLLLVPLFVPQPLLVAGWMMLIERVPVPLSGLAAAIVLHAIIALPWVVLLVGLGLCLVERSMEEDALTAAPPWRVLIAVSLRRAWPAVMAATLWVGLQTVSEIGVTDLFQVRTFAEEVYTQMVRPEGAGEVALQEARAVAISLPFLLLMGGLVVLMVHRGQKRFPPLFRLNNPLVFSLRRGRVVLALGTTLIIVVFVGVPVAGLLWKTGLEGAPPHWTLDAAGHHLIRAWLLDRGRLGEALLLAAWVGGQTAMLALLGCWLAREHRAFRGLVIAVGVLVWLLPGPIVGLGMKQVIKALLGITNSEVLAVALYHGPSWLPVAWVQTIQLLPLALALLWPVIRSLPRGLFEMARVEGASAGQELHWIVVPLVWGAWWRSSMIVAALSLGEVSATKLVSTPGATPFAQHVFMELHYGVGNHLAAQCLLVLLTIVPLALLLLWTGRKTMRFST